MTARAREAAAAVLSDRVRRVMQENLDEMRPPELPGPIYFEVFVDSSRPEECGPLSVYLDARGIVAGWPTLAWKRWELTWADLAAIAHNKFELVKERDDLEEEIRVLANIAREEKGEATVLPLARSAHDRA